MKISIKKFVLIQVRSLAALSLIVGALAANGCGSAEKPRSTPKAEAVQEWNHARAGVMANLARDQFQGGNFDKARSTVDDALKADPQNASLYVLSARIAIEQDILSVAEQHLAEARRLSPNDAEALYLSGVVVQRWQKFDQALAYYTQAVGQQPSELAYLMARAEMLVLLDRPQEAEAVLRTKLVFFEHSAAIRDAVGQMLLQQKKYAEAAELFQQASILSPKDMSIKERMATALFQSGDTASAGETLGYLSQLPAYATRTDIWMMLGECQLDAGRAADARSTFQKVTELNAASAEAWLGLAKASLAVNDLKRAETSARRAQALSPKRADCHLTLGYVYMKQDRLNDAVHCFRTASEIDPTDSVSICLIGQVQDRRGDHVQALTSYGWALQVNPQDEVAAKLLTSATID